MERGLFFLLLALSVASVAGKLHYRNSVEVTDESLEALLSQGPVFLNLCTNWVAAGKSFRATWEKMAEELRDHPVTVAHLDISENHVSKARFGVRDVPWLVLVKDDVVYRFDGQGDTLVRDVELYADFARGQFLMTEHKGPLPEAPHLPQWFTTKDYVNPVTGETHLGADPGLQD